MDFLSQLFQTDGFPPRWQCGTGWTQFLGYLHIFSDLATWIAYTTIPVVLLVVARRDRSFPLNRVFLLFAAFILLCGSVHLLEAVIFYVPFYRLSGVLKLLTAIVSWATVITLVRVAPKAIELPGLKAVNKRLKGEIRRRNAAEKRLADSELRFRATFENAAVGIANVAIDGRWLRVNQQLCQIVGYPQEELLKKTFQDITHPDDLQADLERVQQLLDGKLDQFSIEKRYLHRQGHLVWVSLTVSLIRDHAGKPDYFISIVQDITARKVVERELMASESRLKLAKDLASVGVLYCDYQQNAITLDEIAADLFDLPDNCPLPREEVHGRFHLDDRPMIEASLQGCFQGHSDGRVSMEHRVVRSDGTTLWLDVCKQVRFHENDEGQALPHDSLIAVIDQTERKQHEALLENARSEAESANEARGQFLANMSHEIRTPMAAIMGHIDILWNHLKDPDNRQCVATIKRNGKHLLDIINDILDLSRIEAGKMEARREPCELPQWLSDIETLMGVRVERNHVDFRVVTPAPIPTSLTIDSKRLKQILINLLGNAIKFTKQGKVELQVSYDVGQQLLVCTVLDTGIGIPADYLPSLFQPFSQGDVSRTREFGGSGLGLAISKRLADLLGGSIEAQSVEGEGSVFRVSLPAQPSPDSDWFQYAGALTDDEMPVERVGISLRGRILLVDDRRDIRYVGQHFLEEAGATVTTAENGEAAVRLIQQQEASGEPFEVVVMDVQMPKMDGLTAVRHLRQQGCRLPIIALTADAMLEDRERCLNAGYDGYLAKPIDAAALVESVAKYLK